VQNKLSSNQTPQSNAHLNEEEKRLALDAHMRRTEPLSEQPSEFADERKAEILSEQLVEQMGDLKIKVPMSNENTDQTTAKPTLTDKINSKFEDMRSGMKHLFSSITGKNENLSEEDKRHAQVAEEIRTQPLNEQPSSEFLDKNKEKVKQEDTQQQPQLQRGKSFTKQITDTLKDASHKIKEYIVSGSDKDQQQQHNVQVITKQRKEQEKQEIKEISEIVKTQKEKIGEEVKKCLEHRPSPNELENRGIILKGELEKDTMVKENIPKPHQTLTQKMKENVHQMNEAAKQAISSATQYVHRHSNLPHKSQQEQLNLNEEDEREEEREDERPAHVAQEIRTEPLNEQPSSELLAEKQINTDNKISSPDLTKNL
jgi:hypothetical protein